MRLSKSTQKQIVVPISGWTEDRVLGLKELLTRSGFETPLEITLENQGEVITADFVSKLDEADQVSTLLAADIEFDILLKTSSLAADPSQTDLSDSQQPINSDQVSEQSGARAESTATDPSSIWLTSFNKLEQVDAATGKFVRQLFYATWPGLLAFSIVFVLVLKPVFDTGLLPASGSGMGHLYVRP